jgi:hypothetical protein
MRDRDSRHGHDVIGLAKAPWDEVAPTPLPFGGMPTVAGGAREAVHVDA